MDRLCPASLLRILLLGRSAGAIWHFDPATPAARWMVRWLLRLGLLRAEVKQVDCDLGQVRDDTGKFEWDRLWAYIRDTGARIKAERINTDPLIRKAASTWDPAKISIYFEKKVERELRDECYRFGLVEWMARNRLAADPGDCVLVLKRWQWYSYIRDLARSRGVATASYRDPWEALAKAGRLAFKGFTKGWLQALGLSRDLIRRIGALSAPPRPSDSGGRGGRKSASAIGIRYYFRSLSLDPSIRSEFFWLHDSGIPFSEVLLYDYVTDKPVDGRTLEQLRERGIRLLGRGPGVPAWRPTPGILRILAGAMFPLVRGVLSCWARGKWVSPYSLRGLAALALDYSYWHDFYGANGVRVNVSAMHNLRVSQVLALDALNGVTAVYQYTSSIIYLAASYLYAGEDIVFVFSSAFEELWHRVRAPVNSIVKVGFVDDGAVRHLRELGRSDTLRRELEANGARFVLSYYDENSTTRWSSYGSDEASADDYEFLLRWLLADPSLGIVFKPKKATNLLQRIHRVRGLVDNAVSTGRCRFLMGETVIGSIFPAEAALASDVCIGKVGAAALESRLAGVPSVMIDLEGFRNDFYYRWGRGRIVFDDWPSLRAAIETYRADPDRHPEFGDWSPGLDDVDPFRDGNASRRLGLYIGLVHDALKRGTGKAEALSEAAEKYAGGARSLVRTG